MYGKMNVLLMFYYNTVLMVITFSAVINYKQSSGHLTSVDNFQFAMKII